jgi:hypothetical protein
MRTLSGAPAASPLAAVNGNQAVAVLLAMLDEAESQSASTSSSASSSSASSVSTAHEDLGYELAAEICANAAGAGARCFAHAFSLLAFRGDNQHNIKAFRHLAQVTRGHVVRRANLVH